MGNIVRFAYNDDVCWSRVDWENGVPVYISIAKNGVLVKKTNPGVFGKKLYGETDIHACVAISRVLDNHILIDESFPLVPDGLTSPVLVSFTRLALQTNSSEEFCAKINDAKQLVLQGKL
jgi:hypothetical protein